MAQWLAHPGFKMYFQSFDFNSVRQETIVSHRQRNIRFLVWSAAQTQFVFTRQGTIVWDKTTVLRPATWSSYQGDSRYLFEPPYMMATSRIKFDVFGLIYVKPLVSSITDCWNRDFNYWINWSVFLRTIDLVSSGLRRTRWKLQATLSRLEFIIRRPL